MTFLADAHREWHTVNGATVVCPLDCGIGEYDDPRDALAFGGTIRCGCCGYKHPDVSTVRLCHEIG